MPSTEDIAWACRAMERQKIEYAKSIENPMVRRPFDLAAKRFGDLARRFERALRGRKKPWRLDHGVCPLTRGPR